MSNVGQNRTQAITRPFALAGALFLLSHAAWGIAQPRVFTPQTTSSAARSEAHAATAPGAPLSAEQLAKIIPANVYFQGKSAPVQIRNAGGAIFADGATLWTALVDSSGYSTSIQEKYQFYFVTEDPVRVGGVSLPAGVYGGGFLKDHFLLMDVGGHTVAQGPLQTDSDLRRPRPLQVLPDSATSVKLYLGRRWVKLEVTESHP